MAETFTELGFATGADLSLALATVGLVSGVIVGTILLNWGLRTGRIQVNREVSIKPENAETQHPEEEASIRIARENLVRDLLIDPLSLNFGFVGLAIAIGWLILEGLRTIESITWGRGGLLLISYVINILCAIIPHRPSWRHYRPIFSCPYQTTHLLN